VRVSSLSERAARGIGVGFSKISPKHGGERP
jgi:hypothetical protein